MPDHDSQGRKSVRLFWYMTEVLDIAASARADKLRERLKAAGIAWEESTSRSDCEAIKADPDSPGEWTVSLESRSSRTIFVSEADGAQARAILAELP